MITGPFVGPHEGLDASHTHTHTHTPGSWLVDEFVNEMAVGQNEDKLVEVTTRVGAPGLTLPQTCP